MLTWYLGNPSNYQQRRKRNLTRPSYIQSRNKEVPRANKQHNRGASAIDMLLDKIGKKRKKNSTYLTSITTQFVI